MIQKTSWRSFVKSRKLKKKKVTTLVSTYGNLYIGKLYRNKQALSFESFWYYCLFFWTKPKQQIFFHFVWLHLKKQQNISTYTLLSKYLSRPRAFRRNAQNAPSITVVMWYLYKFLFQKPILLHIKNFSHHSVVLLKTFFQNFDTQHFSIFVKKGYTVKRVKRRRIKRRVYKAILRDNNYRK